MINSLISRAWPCTFFSLFHRVAKDIVFLWTRRTTPILINYFPPYDSKTCPSVALMVAQLRRNVRPHQSMPSSCRELWLISGLRIKTFTIVWNHLWHIISSKMFHKVGQSNTMYSYMSIHMIVLYHISIACKTWLSQQSMCLIMFISYWCSNQ